jgi:hypothetical protein
MQMGYDFPDGPQVPGPRTPSGGSAEAFRALGDKPWQGLAPAPERPDWTGLRARFIATHALRRSLESAVAGAIPAGGFLAAAEAVLASARGEAAVVNRICSGNGKAGAGMIAALSPPVPREATEDTHD